jgi:hypothetical protein
MPSGHPPDRSIGAMRSEGEDSRESKTAEGAFDAPVSVGFIVPALVDQPGDRDPSRLMDLLARCLHQYVEAHPELFDIQEPLTPAGRIRTVTRAKE